MTATRLSAVRDTSAPIQTDGLEFIEFTAAETQVLEDALIQLGFVCVADHNHKNVRLYRQNSINFIVNGEGHSLASDYATAHGPSSNALAFRVPNVTDALQSAREMGLEVIASTAGPMELNIPAVRGVGDALIYLVDRYGATSIYDIDFTFRTGVERMPYGWLQDIDHVTQNVRCGELVKHTDFYKRTFGFCELQTFNIHGKHSGLDSVALISSCGRIKIPINEPTDPKSQIAEFLDIHHGGGVQHIALTTSDIFEAVKACRANGTVFQSTPSTYYHNLHSRHIGHNENVEQLMKHNVLIDGNPDDGILLQIFTRDMIGPLFFELIQRKGNRGFGEGNFQALFESIERNQAARGVFDEAV
ncbi:MAG: 4-hydroxyphenylpyruvate dioxygenase [Gammaproteobacteria bacterium]|nr:4-hydroxyphenylpyruvate dioxygenase [Gammaproteobacteria bacterium]